MKQTVATGVFFVCGILAGTLLSAYFVGTSSSRSLTPVAQVVSSSAVAAEDPASVYRDGMTSKHLANLTRELIQLRETVKSFNGQRNETKIVYIDRKPVTHEEVEKLDANGPQHTIKFDDHHEHKDDDGVAKELYDKVRVLCWIMTSPGNLQKKAIHVKATWAKRCNKLLIMSDVEDKDFPAVGLGTDLGRDHLTAKTMRAFDYVYKHHFDDADWFMKADDDTYVIVENLRYLLSAHAPTESVYFGHHFKVIVDQGYFSGGAGYVLSKEALGRFGKRDPGLCAVDNGAEDVEIGRCMQKLGIKTGDSRDKLGRSRFHCFNPETHLHGGYPDWYLQYDKYGAKKGIESISDNPVSFHYVTKQQMYDLEFFVYHINAYGIINGLQDLNGPVDENLIKKNNQIFTTSRAPKAAITAALAGDNNKKS